MISKAAIDEIGHVEELEARARKQEDQTHERNAALANIGGQATLLLTIVERVRPSVCKTFEGGGSTSIEGRIQEFDLDTIELIANYLKGIAVVLERKS